MVTKKRTARKARSRTVYRTAAKKTYRRKKSGITDIPAAAATVALVAVNANAIKDYANYLKTYGSVITHKDPIGDFAARMQKTFVNKQQIIKDAAAIAGGYVGGEVVKKYAPSVLKSPLGKIAKKIPKVF